MSDTSELLKTQNATQSMPQKPSALKESDLALVAERLALIQGHISQMPAGVLSGVRILNGFLLVAVKITGHEFSMDGDSLKLDGQELTQLIQKDKK